ALRERPSSGPKRAEDANGLGDEPMQLAKDRAVSIGLLVFLITGAADGDEPGICQPGQEAVRRAGPAAREADQLSALKAALRLSVEQSQHALLNRRKEGVG